MPEIISRTQPHYISLIRLCIFLFFLQNLEILYTLPLLLLHRPYTHIKNTVLENICYIVLLLFLFFFKFWKEGLNNFLESWVLRFLYQKLNFQILNIFNPLESPLNVLLIYKNYICTLQYEKAGHASWKLEKVENWGYSFFPRGGNWWWFSCLWVRTNYWKNWARTKVMN